MRILPKCALFLLLIYFLPMTSYANPATPHAVTLAWDQINVTTAEGVDVWLRINVLGAAPTELVDLKFVYQSFGQTATTPNDYDPTNWPSGTKGTITGLNRVAYIKMTIRRNDYYEPIEYFQVELRSDASNTVISGAARANVYIARSRLMNPLVWSLEACSNGGEPNNNFAPSAGSIALNGGWCNSDFNNETINAVDYYHVTSSRGGTITIQLENTTPDQHEFQLYLYYRDSTGVYQFYRQSINPGQQTELISAPIAANTGYLISVFFETDTGAKIPTYRLKADFN